MKKVTIFLILIILILLRFSTSVRFASIYEDDIYKMKLDLKNGRANVLKINDKYPLKKVYANYFYKENGKYEGYFLVKFKKEFSGISFLDIEEIKAEKINKNFLENYFEKVYSRSQEKFTPEIRAVNRALLLGDSSDISKEIRKKISYVGLSHIFAISGLHVGLIFSFFQIIFLELSLAKKMREILILTLISIYYFGIKESPSFTRAYIMIVIFLLGKIFYEKVSLKKSLLISAIISILINPTVIFSISFQLSYLAVIAIIYVYPYLKKLNKKNYKILDYFILSVAIQIILFPVLVYNFGILPLFSIITNVFLIPISTFYIILDFISLFLENFHLSFIFTAIIELLNKVLFYLIEIFSKLPYLSIEYKNDKIFYIYPLFIIFIFLINNWRNLYEDYKKRM